MFSPNRNQRARASWWISQQKGKPQKCEKCLTDDPSKLYGWVNKSRRYKLDTNDWVRLCRHCHHVFGMRIYKQKDRDEAYFKQRAQITKSGCWEWKLQKNPAGYGLIRTGSYAQQTREQHLAHREAYKVFFGEYDKELHVLHKCDNPPCINPKHLFLGTQADNNRDMRNKGRGYSKLSVEQVLEIRESLGAGARPVDLAREYGVKPCQIGAIKFRRQWRFV